MYQRFFEFLLQRSVTALTRFFTKAENYTVKIGKQSFSANRKLLLIFLLALFLRLVLLWGVPSGFHNDEVDLGYVGKYLVLHGKDPAGNLLPVAFDKFEDFRPTGPFYLSGISQLIFGSSEFAVRFPTALFGALTILPMFFLATTIFKRKDAGYFAAFFLAILPWHIVLSRAAHEAIVGYFLIVSGLYFLFKFLDDNKQVKKYLVFSFLSFFISYFFYHGTRVLVPMILLPAGVFLRKRIVMKFFAVFLVLAVIVIISPLGKGRLSQVIFYKNPGLEKKIQELPFADRGDIFGARVFHNKPVVYTRELIGNYLQYFSGDFLFMRGGLPERYLVVETGLFYLTMGFFGLLGFVRLFFERKGLIVIAWIIISPIPAVLTYEDVPSVTRASFLMFPLVLCAALGFLWTLDNLKDRLWKKVFVYGSAVFLLLEVAFFAHQYFVHQKFYKGILRDEGAREIARYIEAERPKYDLVVAQYGPNLPSYFLFFNNHFSEVKIDISDKNSDFRFENVIFTRDGCPSHRADHYQDQNVLYIDESNCEIKPGREGIFSIVRADLTEAFRALIVVK